MARQWVATGRGGIDDFEEREYEPAEPGPGEVTIEVRAAGMNPADWKYARRDDPATEPRPVGFEVAGVITAIGPDTTIGSGGGAVGDEVLAFRISGGYASAVTVPARAVFAKPASLPWAAAANLLLAGTTAAEMLHVTRAEAGDTILLHGASGAVGVSVLQQAVPAGIRVIGTSSEANADVVRSFGGEWVPYGDGLEQRVRDAAPDGIAAALDCVGTEEAIDVSLALVDDRTRIVSIANFARAEAEGYRVIAGQMKDSAVFRDAIRQHLVDLAGDGKLVVPVAREFPLSETREALHLLAGEHPGGKLALIP